MKADFYSTLDGLRDTMGEIEGRLDDLPGYPAQADKDKVLKELDAFAATLGETVRENAAEAITPKGRAAREKTWSRINHVRNIVAGKAIDERSSEA